MRHPLPVLVALLAVPPAGAQTPPAAADKNTVTAEAVEVIRARPDQAKLYFTVLVKNPDAVTATDESGEQTKQFVDAIDKLKLKGVKAAGLSQRLNRVETQNRNVANAPFVPEFHAARSVVVTVTDPDPDKLPGLVEKVQQEAAKQGVGGDGPGNATYNGFNYERNSPVRVTYSRRDGWDEETVGALGKATKKALARAEAMAAGAGLKLGEVLSIGEPATTIGSQTIYNYANYSSGVGNTSTAADAQDEFTDGELVRKVRVRVVVAVSAGR
jgi:uncharacterized protein YggE